MLCTVYTGGFVVCTVLCQCLCYRLSDGSCVEQFELSPTPELQCALTKDGSIDNMSELYNIVTNQVIAFFYSCLL